MKTAIIKKTKESYEYYLNDFPVPKEDKKSNGGRIDDKTTRYGTWIRRNDPIAFNVGFREWCEEQ
jgi:hypothetical protein